MSRDELPAMSPRGPGPAEAMTFGQLADLLRGLDDQAVDLSRPDRPHKVPGRRQRVVGVDGLSGAGKSGFARRLAAELGAPVLSTDDLVPGWDALAESVALLTEWVLVPLAAGRPARWRRYDWIAGRPAEWVDVEPGDFLVVEGCCVGVPPAAAGLSYLIWIDAPAGERRRRLELRSDWAAYQPFFESWTRQENALQAAADTPGRAGLVVDNSGRSGTGEWAGRFFRRSAG
ncbi:MAG TPA: hypothetical protein VHF26_19900 [Trebonia sp.]|nr:hypothetical protein [Trebonia sp.]